MSKVVNWIKNNKLTSLLLLVLAFFIWRSFQTNPIIYNSSKMLTDVSAGSVPSLRAINGSTTFGYEAAPAPQVKDRLVVSWSTMSLQVADVAKSLLNIKTYAEGLGGYMVDSSASNPNKVASGNITVRVPSTKLDEALVYLRKQAVQVVSEQLTGTDVTDQYVDVGTRLAILEKTKARFEELALKAVTFSDIMEANRQILQVQDQIDSLKGQQNYLTKTAEMAKVTVYLSTDEFSLPYSPSEPWRPEVIFKEAVRSLVSHVRDAGSALIWLAVYGAVLIPAGLAVLLIYRFVKGRHP